MNETAPERETTLKESYTEMSEILMPNHTNNLGRALGGSVLHWMDICGAIAARRFSHRQVVTASMDHVDFLAPIELGDVVTVEGYVYDTGRTSMEVKIRVQAERPSKGESAETATSFFTFIALDADENPDPVPRLRCPTDSQEALRGAAVAERRARRESLAETIEGTPGPHPDP